MSDSYSIGQVLYLVAHKKGSLIPVQVQEINEKTTIEGTEINYMVMAPDNQGPFILSELDVDIFTNPSEVANSLKNSANRSIDKMVGHSVSVATEEFAVSAKTIKSTELEIPKKPKVSPPSIPPKKKGKNKVSTEAQQEAAITNSNITNIPEPVKIRSVLLPNGERLTNNG